MRILLTGCGGFIGSHLAEYFLENNNFVVGIDNFSTGFEKNMETFKHHENFIFKEVDIRNMNDLTQLFDKYNFDVVCHQAATGSVPRSIKDPHFYFYNNCGGTVNLLECCRLNGIKRFVYASSSSVYGDDDHLPKIEHCTGEVLSPYALTKSNNEDWAIIYAKLYGIKTVGFRYFNIFGERQNPNSIYSAVIPKFIKAIKNGDEVTIFGDGNQGRDFTHVNNVKVANYLALTKDLKYNSYVFNVGCGEFTSVNDLVSKLQKFMSCEAKIKYCKPRQGDVLKSLANIENIKKVLGYEIQMSFDEGLSKLVLSSLSK